MTSCGLSFTGTMRADSFSRAVVSNTAPPVLLGATTTTCSMLTWIVTPVLAWVSRRYRMLDGSRSRSAFMPDYAGGPYGLGPAPSQGERTWPAAGR